MLRHLSIRSFALIEDVEFDLEPGITVLVGETGAGKSIIIDALNAALGERLASDSLRDGAKKMVIEATFDATNHKAIEDHLKSQDLDWDSSDLIFRRELTASGTSRLFINDTPSNTSVARELAQHLMDFHGQHDTRGLLNVSYHRDLLDEAADSSVEVAVMKNAWTKLSTARQDLIALEARAQRADEDRANLDYKLREISDIDPIHGEDDQISTDLKLAESSEQVLSAANEARESLYLGDPSAYELLRIARDKVQELMTFDESLSATLEDLEAAMTIAKEASSTLSALAELDDHSPERLEEMRQRQSLLSRLIKKYGSIESAIEIADELRRELSTLDNLDEAFEELQLAVKTEEQESRKSAKRLSKKRIAAASPLQESIEFTLKEMGMPNAQVAVDVKPEELGPGGAEGVEFLFSANAGEEPKPLAKIASGGELSRFMLSLKKALAERGHVGTMVFDEIDTGISGKTARQVGSVMRAIATRHQVICITHLPQIASMANSMIKVSKDESTGRASVTARTVDSEGAVVEVARLMSGTTITETAIDSARELIESGNTQ